MSEPRVVGRPRVVSLAFWVFLIAVGLALVSRGAGGLVFGLPFLVFGVFGFVATWRARVWVEGTTLHSRTLRGDNPPIRLDQLREARLNDYRYGNGRSLDLADASGATIRLDATNVRLVHLYAVLAEFIDSNDRVANTLLH